MTRDEYMAYLQGESIPMNFGDSGWYQNSIKDTHPAKSYTPEEAVSLYNNLDPALANDPEMLKQILRGSNYWKSEGSFLPGEKITTADNFRAGLGRWKEDDKASGLDSMLSKAVPAALLAGAGYAALGPLGTEAGLAGETAADIGAYGGATDAASSIVAGSGAGTAATAGGLSQIASAATDYLAKYASPEFLATEAGKAAVGNAVSQLIQTGTIDIGRVFDPESFAKNMALGAVSGAATAAGSTGLQQLGMGAKTAGNLANAGVGALQGRDPTGALVGAGLSALDVPTKYTKYAQPAITGLISGKGNLKDVALSGLLNEARQPMLKELGWDSSKSNSPLTWLKNAAIKSAVDTPINYLAGQVRKKG